MFLNRRKQAGGFSRRVFGCGVPLDKPTEIVRKRVAGSFDFVTLPFVWRDIEPSEQTFNWKALDARVEALANVRAVAGEVAQAATGKLVGITVSDDEAGAAASAALEGRG